MPTLSGGTEAATPEANLRSVLQAEIEGSASLLFAGWPDESGVAEYRHVPIWAALAHQLAGLVESWRQKHIDDDRLPTIREYDSAPQPGDAQGIQHIRITANAHLRGALGAAMAPTGIPMWTARDRVVGKPKSFVISVTLRGAGTARFFGHLSASKELRGPGKVLAYIEGRRFRSLGDARAILLEDSFDCVACGEDLFIMRPTRFESLFSYMTSLSAHATEMIDAMQAHIEPANLALFKDKVATNFVLLRRVAGKVKVDLATADANVVRQVVTDYGFNVKVRTTDAGLVLGFENDDPRDLVSLLTDSAVVSAITRKKFIATAKTEVTTGSASSAPPP